MPDSFYLNTLGFGIIISCFSCVIALLFLWTKGVAINKKIKISGRELSEWEKTRLTAWETFYGILFFIILIILLGLIFELIICE